MGFESRITNSNEEFQVPHIIGAMREVHGKLQAIVALKHFKELHPEKEIDTDHPENNPPEVRKVAMLQIISDGSAAIFSDYREDHWDDLIDLSDPAQLQELYQSILHPGDTIH